MNVLGILEKGLASPRKVRAVGSAVCQEAVEPKSLGGTATEICRRLRKRKKIHLYKISGCNLVPIERSEADKLACPIQQFEETIEGHQVSKDLCDSLRVTFGFTAPTPIQSQAIPFALERRSFVATGPTGSGKTIAFLLPVLHSLRRKRRENSWVVGCKALILAPTKELANQTLFQKGSTDDFTVSSAKSLEDAKTSDVIVSTPGLSLLLKKCSQLLIHVEIVVLDEADELFDAKFVKHCDTILSGCKREGKQIMMFSATLPTKVLDMASSVLHSACIVVQVGAQNSAAPKIEQILTEVGNEQGKRLTIKSMIVDQELIPPCLIFVQDKERAIQLHQLLSKMKLKVGVLHSNLDKDERELALQMFRQGRTWILVCTDVLARGIDCYGVRLVINYDFPTSREAYIHRVGRTGRAGSSGKAITFFTETDKPYLRLVTSVLKQNGVAVPKELEEEPRASHLNSEDHENTEQ